MTEGSGSASRTDEGSGLEDLPTMQEAGRPSSALPRFGRYQLVERIGRGGMAEVFLAVMEGPEGFRRRCVVKRIKPEKSRSSYYTQMFVDEARITAALHHPNIVQVYEFGEIGDLLYLTMEHLDGKNLGAVLDSLQLRERLFRPMLAAQIVQQIARGLHHAHSATDDDGRPLGVIHRDMSPTNVMLLLTGEVKILDFGVAMAEPGLKQGATTVGRVKGKLPYMAPEQHSGRPLDCRADLFSVGVILWEMLTGELLLGEGSDRSRRVMSGRAPRPSELRGEVSPALDEVVLRCLQPVPDRRFPSAAALIDALAAAMGEDRFDPAELGRLVGELAGAPVPLPAAAPLAGSEGDPAAAGPAGDPAAPAEALGGRGGSLESEGLTVRGPNLPPSRPRTAAIMETGMIPVRRSARLPGGPWRAPVLAGLAVAAVASAVLLLVRTPEPRLPPPVADAPAIAARPGEPVPIIVPPPATVSPRAPIIAPVDDVRAATEAPLASRASLPPVEAATARTTPLAAAEPARARGVHRGGTSGAHRTATTAAPTRRHPPKHKASPKRRRPDKLVSPF